VKTIKCVCLCHDDQDGLRRASYVVHRLATQLTAAVANMADRHPQPSKRNSGILDIVLGMPDLLHTGRK